MAKTTTVTQPKWEVKERVYILTGDRLPVNYLLRSKHSNNKPLQWFDAEMQVSRSLCYATNQTSVFEDEQNGAKTTPAIIFENGSLIVPAENVQLQKFLSIYHPDNGKEYIEFDPNKEAEADIAVEEAMIDAQNAVRELDIEELEAIARVALKGENVSTMTSKEIKRDMLMYARMNPDEVMQLIDDENIYNRNIAVRAVEMGILAILDDNQTVVWNDKKKSKIMTAPFGQNVYSALASFFKTDDGLDVLKGIENKL